MLVVHLLKQLLKIVTHFLKLNSLIFFCLHFPIIEEIYRLKMEKRSEKVWVYDEVPPENYKRRVWNKWLELEAPKLDPEVLKRIRKRRTERKWEEIAMQKKQQQRNQTE